MRELPTEVRRAFDEHPSFEPAPEPGLFRSTTTPFDALVDAFADGETAVLEVVVRVPMLDEVTVERVADVVEDGWYDTFELRVVDVGGVTKAERDASPSVRRSVDDGTRVAVVEATVEDENPRRGVDDAKAIIDFVEGTYVQGVIPGYDYEEPVVDLISQAHATGGSDGESLPPG